MQSPTHPVQSTAQLARELGLSRWTVSRALNGHSSISPETAARVLEMARHHGFSPNILGRGLRAGKTNLVGICLPGLEEYYLTSKVSRLTEAVAARQHQPVLQIIDGTPEAENAALERFAAMRCAAVVIIASRLKEDTPGLRSLTTAQTTVLRIDPLEAAPGRTAGIDRREAMRAAVEHLHGLGHRRAAVFGFHKASAYSTQRQAGLKSACKRFGWDWEHDVLFFDSENQKNDFEAGGRMAEQFLRTPQRPSAIIALNDRMALGATHKLQSAGLRVPKDVSVIGYDNADFSAYTEPSLTTLDPHVETLISRAVDLLFSKEEPTRPVLVRPKLIARDSTGPAPKKLSRMTKSKK